MRVHKQMQPIFIKLDLDDGVKVNYGKFLDILAEVRAVTCGAEE